MISSWVLFPLGLIALCCGCGLLLQAAVGRRLSAELIPALGFTVVVVLAGILTSRGEVAPLATPAVLAAALLGVGLHLLRRRGEEAPGRWLWRRVDGWAVAAAAGAFLVYAAPVVLSGRPTFAGYIKLDDTATWMAFVDRVMDHGRDLSGLVPSSYRSTLEVNLPAGYPVGAFLPLGVGTQLTRTDVAWLVQPYMATVAALLALCLYWLVQPLIDSRPLRALIAFAASQSALLFAYSLWGGVKEVAVALGIAVLAATAAVATRAGYGWRGMLPAAIATTALLASVGSGGAVWVLPALALAALAVWRLGSARALLWRAAILVLLVAILAIPALFAAEVFSPTQGGLTNASELGNLVGPLSVLQYLGIWPTGDFRLDPVNQQLADFLIGLGLVAALAGIWLCWQRRAWRLLLYLAGASIGSLAVFAYSSPWVGAKALASGSPALLLIALVGAASFAIRVERVLGATVLAMLVSGVLWSNALGYHDVNLAPYDQLRELQSIGEQFAGQGPTLMTEYQPYGVRHFLRAAEAEGASELRYRSIPLREGGELEKGAWGDTDQISLPALLTYRTLVLRRSPAQSRPPSSYSLVRHGTYYDVWQASPAAPEIVEHLPLGDFEDPGAVLPCGELLTLADVTGAGGTVAAAERAATVSASLAESSHPPTARRLDSGSPALLPHGAGTVRLGVSVPRPGRYGVYLQGSARNRLTAFVDGSEVGSVSDQLNEASQFLYFGEVPLAAGRHEIALSLAGQSLAPGSGGPPEPIGPLVLDPASNERPTLRELPSSRARVLCGRRLDWVEALR